jgi:hypothetical protein
LTESFHCCRGRVCRFFPTSRSLACPAWLLLLRFLACTLSHSQPSDRSSLEEPSPIALKCVLSSESKWRSQANTRYGCHNLPHLSQSAERFHARFQSQQGWRGVAGQDPDKKALLAELATSDLFVYMGHGSSEQYFEVCFKWLLLTYSFSPRVSTVYRAHLHFCLDAAQVGFVPTVTSNPRVWRSTSLLADLQVGLCWVMMTEACSCRWESLGRHRR